MAAKKKVIPQAMAPANLPLSRAPAVPAPVEFLGDFEGILFIGDPHVFPKAIGRRKDDYLTSVLVKLEFAAEYANTHNLLPICLGDLFHREGVNALSCLNRLVLTLKKFNQKLVVLDGNHDRTSASLTESTALQLLVNTEIVMVPVNIGLSYQARVKGKMVDVHMFPHGVAIPEQVEQSQNTAIGVSHHDLAFGSSYPGSQPLKPVIGLDMVVNGHMHDTKPSELHGATYWHNPGNIEPLSVDLADFVPKVWVWDNPDNFSTLEGVQLPHGTDIFDFEGIAVSAGDAEEAVRVLDSSEFAAQIRQMDAQQASRTDDASVFKEDVREVLQVTTVSPAAIALVQLLTQSVVDEAEALAMGNAP